MYQQAGGSPETGGTADGGASDPASDDVIDAEFSEPENK